MANAMALAMAIAMAMAMAIVMAIALARPIATVPNLLCTPLASLVAFSAHFGEAWRGTLLVLVVIAMEITDLIFAVDSISAIVAQVTQ